MEIEIIRKPATPIIGLHNGEEFTWLAWDTDSDFGEFDVGYHWLQEHGELIRDFDAELGGWYPSQDVIVYKHNNHEYVCICDAYWTIFSKTKRAIEELVYLACPDATVIVSKPIPDPPK